MLLHELAGEAPDYDPAELEPHQYIQQLLQWGAPPGASLEGCVTRQTADGQLAAVDLAALHAVGCFPHAWQVPLTAAGVQAANRRMAAQYAADPAELLQKAMQKGMYRFRRDTLQAAHGLHLRPVGDANGGSSKRAREVSDVEEVEEPLGQATRPPLKRRRRKGSVEQQCLEERFEQQQRQQHQEPQQRQQEREQQQRQQQQPPPPQQQQPGGTGVHAAQPLPSRQAVSSALSSLAAGITERKVEDARAAVVSAASNLTVNSMLRPLQLLVLASKGGETLRVCGAATSLNVTHAWDHHIRWVCRVAPAD
jgi:hypothetical protein